MRLEPRGVHSVHVDDGALVGGLEHELDVELPCGLGI